MTTPPAHTEHDIRRFFGRFAAHNTEKHGAPDRLMAYRMDLLHRYGQFKPTDVVLDVACGDGKHLFALDGHIREGIGVDFSEGMIATACRQIGNGYQSSFSYRTDNARKLETIPDASVDVVMCTGALEHILDKQAVLDAAARVLRPGGRFGCLTLNDGFLW